MERLKEIRSSFWFYDLFGYLLPGFFFLCLLIIDYDLSALMRYSHEHGSLGGILSGKDTIHFKLEYLFKFISWNQTGNDFRFTTLFFLILLCYIIGHIISGISSQVLETWINKGLIGYPSSNLFEKSKKWYKKIFAWIFSNYTKSFDSKFIDKFKILYEKRFKIDFNTNDSFWLCFADISNNATIGYNRATHFLSLYGFNRNIAATFFIYIGVRWVAHFECVFNSSIESSTKFILLIYFLCGLIMMKNYIKLFKRQCTEIYYQFYAANTFEDKEKDKQNN